MWVMLQSVDPHVPKYQDRLLTPGLMIRPCSEGLDVTFNVSQSQTWHQYVRALHQFLEPYNDSVQAARNAACAAGRYNEQPDDAVPNFPKRACRFERSRLGPCAGLGARGDFGYASGRPCVLVKVNRVINFFPGKNKSINIVCASPAHPSLGTGIWGSPGHQILGNWDFGNPLYTRIPENGIFGIFWTSKSLGIGILGTP
ncbi:sodium/potassium-transporting ATPase subunit beta-2-like, partial [Passer montanus]|uniref:sodium/potassium-transporting ATPase subunit beta-2-like n=1 Tax=Passer montanus TaxID=9160 RepID=UPI00195FA553